MAVHFQVAFCRDFKIEFAVFCEQGKHVIHEGNSRGDVGPALSVEVDGCLDICFPGGACYAALSHNDPPKIICCDNLPC